MSFRLDWPAFAVVVLAGCQSPAPEVPARLAAAGSPTQSATVSSLVPVPPTVVVTSDQGNPLAGVVVTFEVTFGGGDVGATQATTNGDGRASALRWTLGRRAGSNQVTAAVAGLSPVRFEAIGAPDNPAQIEVRGDSALGVVGEVLDPAPRLIVRDQYDNPVPGVLVGFEVSTGGGSVAEAERRTDATGGTTIGRWTLGPGSGPHTLVATVGNLDARVTAVARAGAPAQIELLGSGQTGVVGTVVPQSVGVRVRDRFGNPVALVPVSFTPVNAGSVGSSVATTDPAGVAMVVDWRLGTVVGSYSLAVVVDPAAARLAQTLTATAVADAPALLRLVDGDAQMDTVMSLLPRALQVRVTDRHGNPAVGTVTFQVATGGGTVSPAAVTTGPDGNAAAVWRAGPLVGTQVLQARLSQTASLIVFIASIDNPVAFLASVAAGGAFACGLTPTGEAWCWGDNRRGQLGDGTTISRAYASRVQTTIRFARLSLGSETSCGLTSAGQAFCWGRNDLGQSGDGTGIDRRTPRPVTGGLVFQDIGSGGAGACGVTLTGDGYCWGDGSIGQLGTGFQAGALAPVPVAGGLKFTMIRPGGFQTCGIATNRATFCWGKYAYGNLGNPAVPLALSPAPVLGGHAFVTLASGPLTVCGITSANEAYCWGFSGNGNFGDGRRDIDGLGTSTPTRAAGGQSIAEIGIGEATCARTTDGRVLCFGNNSTAQAGAGYTSGAEPNPITTKMPTNVAVTGVTTGQNFSCASTTANIVYCWGYSELGAVGAGRFDTQLEPAIVRHQ